MKQVITTSNAPKAIGPYSQAVRTGNLLFISGQIPLRPDGEMVSGGIEAEARQVLENIKAILAEVGLDFSAVVRSTMYLIDLNDFAKANEIYAEYFKEPYPARVTIQVAALPKGAMIEIETVAEITPHPAR